MKKFAVLIISCIMMLTMAPMCFADGPDATRETVLVSPQLIKPYPYTPNATIQNGDNSQVTQELIDRDIIPLATDQQLQKESAANLPKTN